MHIQLHFRVLISFLLASFWSENSNAQYFEKVYGGNEKISAAYFATTPDKGVVVVGNGFDTTYFTSGYYVLRIDSSGNEVWNQTISNAFSAYAYSVATMANGNIVFLGTHSGVAFQNVAEINVLDSAGNYMNSFVYPPFNGWGTAGIGMSKSGDTSVALTLFNDGFLSNNYYSVFSLNADLTTKWSDFIGFDGSYTNEHGIAACTNGDVYTLAYYDNYFFGPNPLFRVSSIRKHDTNGNVMLDSLYEFDCITTAIERTSDGGAIICGIQDSSFQRDMIIIRIDSLGTVLWQKQYGSFFDEEAYEIIQSADGGFALLGNTVDPVVPGQHDLLLMKLSSNGDSLWARKFGGIYDEVALNVAVEGTNFYLLGRTTSFGNDHIYLVKTDSAGIIQAPYNITSSSRYLCYGDTATLTISPAPTAGMHIQWSTGDTINPATVTHSGNFFATLTDSVGNSITTPFIPVYFSQQPHAAFGSDTISLCIGVPLIDTAFSELTNTYEWFLDGTPIQGENNYYLVPQQPGNYQLIVRNYCSSDTASSYVDTLYELPAEPTIIANAIDYVCPGDSFKLAIAPVSGETFQWYRADDFNRYIIPGATDSVYYVHSDGLYLIEVANANGCTASSLPFEVAFDTDKEFVNPNGPTSFCEGGEVELNVSIGTSFLWSNADTTQSITVDSTGDYFVSFIDQYGCPKSSDTISIVVLNNPVVNLGNDSTVCQSVILTLDAGPGYNNYFWNNSSSDQTLDVSSPGPYPDSMDFFVFVTDTNGCTDSDTIMVVFDICSGITNIVNFKTDVFPNPVLRGTPLSVKSNLSSNQDFILTDYTGREILRSNFTGIVEVYIAKSISEGVYMYRIENSGQITNSGRLIVH